VDAADVAIVLSVVLVAAMAQTIAGFGFALIAVPVFVAAFDVRDGIVLTTLLGVLNSGVLAVTNRASVPWGTVGPMLLGAILAMPLGLLVLLLAPADVIRLLVGVATITMALALLRGLRFGDRSVRSELAVGALSGALNTSTGANGPPVVLYLQGREFPPAEFRAALAVFFFACNVVTLLMFGASGVVSRDAVLLFTVAVPAIVVGNIAGAVIASRVQAEAFRRLVFVLLFASAFSAIAAAAFAVR
jgi:uncharacterized membrane protein YfcA